MPITDDAQPRRLRIGVLCAGAERFAPWERRLLAAIVEDGIGEIAALIEDARPCEAAPKASLPGRVLRLARERKLLIGALSKALDVVEPDREIPFDGSDALDAALASAARIPVAPERRGALDLFSEADADAVAALELDVLLRHGFGILRGPIMSAARAGVWSFHHGDNAENRGGPPGFWEVMNGEPSTGVTLQRLTDQLDGGVVIDKAHFSTQPKWRANQRFVYEKSAALLLKNLRLLRADGAAPEAPSPVYSKPLYRRPTSAALARYLTRYAAAPAARARNAVASLRGERSMAWSLFQGRGQIWGANLFRMKELAPVPSEYWADPFVIERDGARHIFYEAFDYGLGYGKISFARLEDGAMVDRGDALTDLHRSYPFLFERDGEIYLMPEAIASGRLELWRATRFPDEWELAETAFEGVGIADPTLYEDSAGVRWLFVNTSSGAEVNYDSELMIFRVERGVIGAGRADGLTPHRRNPVLIDSRRARSAGRIFQDPRGRVIRPSQRNVGGVYGAGLNLSEISTLTLDAYEERIVERIEPRFAEGLVGAHHFEAYRGGYLIDACRRWRR